MICQIYSCKRKGGRPCCAECSDTQCEERCKNSPERCKCAGARQGGNGSMPKYDRGEMARLRAEGKSAEEIAQIMGCSVTTVWRAIGGKKG